MSLHSSSDEETTSKPPISSVLYDESIDVPDALEVRSPPGSGIQPQGTRQTPETPMSNHRVPGRALSDDNSCEQCVVCQQAAAPSSSGTLVMMHGNGPRQPLQQSGGSTRRAHREGSEASSTEEDEDDTEDEEDQHTATVEGAYDPAEYEHLVVAPEVKELFGHITRYTPQTIELEYRLRPFVPDFIPAVGDIDAFIKIPRHDGVDDGAGLTFLDEPSGKQSDPAVLDLQLRALAKQSSARTAVVKKVDHAERNSRAVDKWIRDISDLHRSRPPPAVQYSRTMPDIDNLMQEWPAPVEERLQEVGVPPPDLECDLSTYVDIMCGLFDIPVYESRIQSLHVLFSLYAAIKHSKYNPDQDFAQ